MSSTNIYGGYLADLPIKPPYRREFDDPSSVRQIKVTVSRWYGIGIHYYVSAQEDDNPIDIGGGTYQRAWDDEEGKGRTWSLGRFAKYKDARRVADRFIRDWKTPGYEIELQDCEEESPIEHFTPEWD